MESRAICALIGSIVFLGTCVVASVASAAAPDFPKKPIRIITPFPPGATTDLLSRIIGQKMTETWGQPVVTENRAGANGMIGTSLAAKSPPDGYTLVNVTSGLSVNPFIYSNSLVDPVKDLAPVIPLARITNVVTVHPSVPARTIKEFITLVKTKPGKWVYGSSGSGSSTNLAGEMLRGAAGVDIVHVPYKGGAPAVTDLIAGQIPMVMATLTTIAPHIKSGKAIGLAVTSAARQPALPAVPTLQESGFRDFEANEWWGILVPAGTPKEIISVLHAEIKRIMALPEVRERLAQVGIEQTSSTPEEFGAFIRMETEKLGKVVKEAGISPQ